MTHILVERHFDPTLNKAEVGILARESENCLDDWNVQWHGSLLASSGDKMLCHFEAVDIESVRMALRQSGWNKTLKAIPVSYHQNTTSSQDTMPLTGVIVERYFDQARSIEDIQAIENAGIECLKLRSVRFVHTFFSLDKKSMFCFYLAPDAEAVRAAQRQAKMPVNSVWACHQITPVDL